jgi:hypothetical protein
MRKRKHDDSDSAPTDVIKGGEAIAEAVGEPLHSFYYHQARGHYGDAVWRFGERQLRGSRSKLKQGGFLSGERA